MDLNRTVQRYHQTSMALHWVMLALFVAVYASIELRVIFEKGTPPREAIKSLHFMLGLLVFAMVWLRISMRIKYPAPSIAPAPTPTLALAAKLGHLALYALMIGMPIMGWLILSAEGKPVPFFGLELPALIGKNKELGKQLKEIHELVGTAGYFLIGGHAAAALFHHFIKRDNTLLNMLPARKS